MLTSLISLDIPKENNTSKLSLIWHISLRVAASDVLNIGYSFISNVSKNM